MKRHSTIKRAIAAVGVAMVAATVAVTAAHANITTVDIGDLEYELEVVDATPTARVLGLSTAGQDVTDLTVPATVHHDGQDYTVTTVVEDAFYENESLGSVTFAGPITIGNFAFEFNTSLESVHFLDDVDTIGFGAFFGTASLHTLTFDGTVRVIENEAFYDHRITDLTLPGGIERIQVYAFGGLVPTLKSVTFEGSVGFIGDGAFWLQDVESIAFNGDVGTIEHQAFDTDELTSLTFGTVVMIDLRAFEGNKLTAIEFPSTVGTIGYRAFANSSELTSLTFAGTVGQIGTEAFANSPNLESVFMRGPVPTVGSTIFGDGDPLVRYYWRHSVDAGVVGGYTSPEWEGYPSQAVVVVDFVLPEPFGIDAVELDAHTTLSAPEPIPGFDVTSWTTDEAGTEVWDFADPVTTDLTLYAQEPRVAVFSDVPVDHHFFTDIAWLVAHGITTGYDDGTFRPNAHVSRQAMAAFLYRMAGEPSFTPPATASFSDVGTGHDFFHEIEWLATTGITAGYDDGTFRPTAPVSRQAMAAFLFRMAGEPSSTASFSDVDTGHDFVHEIEWLATTGITTGYSDGTFRPNAHVSRQAMAAFLQRYDALDA